MKVLSFDKKTYTLYCNSRSHPILFNSYEENGWKDSGWVKVPDSNFLLESCQTLVMEIVLI